MDRLRKAVYGLNPWILSCVSSILLVGQVVLVLFLGHHSPNRLATVTYAGYAVWILSAVFGIVPIFAFRARGGVEQGKSYMRTTALVDSGIYSVVRHPQYLAGVLWSLAMVLLAQTWQIAIMGAVTTMLSWLDAVKADRYCIEKFGAEYERYMERVPRLNALTGIVRLVHKTTAT